MLPADMQHQDAIAINHMNDNQSKSTTHYGNVVWLSIFAYDRLRRMICFDEMLQRSRSLLGQCFYI